MVHYLAGRKPKLDAERSFEAYYYLREVADRDRLHLRDVEERFEKEYGLKIDHTNISRAVSKIAELLSTDEATKTAYVNWKATKGSENKVFYRTDPITGKITSDYATVQKYIDRRMRSARGPGDMVSNLKAAEKCWLFLDKKDPANWEEEDVHRYLAEGRTLKHKPHNAGTRLTYLGAARQVAPKVKAVDDGTKDFKRENRRVNPIIHSPVFLAEFKQILASDQLTEEEKFAFKLHVILGSREGYEKTTTADGPKEASLRGLTWDECYNPHTVRMRVFESKAGGWWNNIPLDALDPAFKAEFRRYWESRGKPTKGVILDFMGEDLPKRGAYLTQLYAKIKRSFPFIAGQKFTPHFGRKTHANIMWELGYPSEVIVGDATSGEGYVGCGETDLSTYQKYYLSLSKTKLDEYRKAARDRFEGAA